MAGGIVLTTNFDVNTGLPLDSRAVVADVAARDAIPALVRYIGLPVFVASESKNYQLVGGILNSNWTEFAGAGGLPAAGPSKIYGTDIDGIQTTYDLPWYWSGLAYKIFGSDQYGAQAEFGYSKIAQSDTVPMRTGEGQILANTLLDSDVKAGVTDLLTRGYFAAKFPSVTQTITANNQSIALGAEMLEQRVKLLNTTGTWTLSTTPFGTTPPAHLAKIIISGPPSDTYLITIPGNGSTANTVADGEVTLGKGSQAVYVYDSGTLQYHFRQG